MHRFYLPPALAQSPALSLSGPEAHHASRVLRLHAGDRVTVLDGAGSEMLCDVAHITRDAVRLTVVERRTSPAPACEITLLQALPKGKLIESIIQKATEIGASRIVPLLSERVVAQLDPEDAAHKAEKWQAVAVEAIKQCGSAWLPRVEAPLTPAEFLARNEPFELPLIASLQPGSRHAREHFRAFHARHHRQPRTLSIWVGPEGDFSPAEVKAIQDSGALPITLGRLVLRTETAAIYCLSILNHELQSPSA
jgi:16S rRNA (uracil1498-N3)-methyltransferase